MDQDEKSPAQWTGFSQAYVSLTTKSWRDMPFLEPIERKVSGFWRLTPALRRIVVASAVAFVLLVLFLMDRSSTIFRSRGISFMDKSHNVVASACDRIPQWQLRELVERNTMSAYLFSEGAVISRPVQTGETVCILVAVPQVPADQYYDVPIPGKGPDNLHLLIGSSSTILTFPPLLPVPKQPGLDRLFYDGTILYWAEKEMKDVGTFNIAIEQEWRNWHWGRQFRKHARAWGEEDPGYYEFPTGIQWPYMDRNDSYFIEARNISQTNIPVQPVDIMPNPLTVVGKPRDLNMRRACSDTVTAARGRWYLNETTDGTVGELTDEWGYTWEGDDCRTDYYTEGDIMDCFAGKKIHMYGDSNMRRIAKTILSGGRWCPRPQDKCQGEDSEEWNVMKLVPNSTKGGALDAEMQHLDHHWSFTDEPPWHFDFGKGSQLHFKFLRSIVEFPQDWDYAFIGEDKVNATLRSYNHLMSEVHAPADMGDGKPDVIMLSINAWSSAFDPFFSDLEHRIPWFRDTILKAFSEPDITIILRLSNGLCCRTNYGHLTTRYTGTRIQHINDIVREAFGIPPGGVRSSLDHRIIAIDPIDMAGRPGVVTEFGEVFNVHPRVSHVRVETQMILNAVCEREQMTGRARMRDRTPLKLEGIPFDEMLEEAT